MPSSSHPSPYLTRRERRTQGREIQRDPASASAALASRLTGAALPSAEVPRVIVFPRSSSSLCLSLPFFLSSLNTPMYFSVQGGLHGLPHRAVAGVPSPLRSKPSSTSVSPCSSMPRQAHAKPSPRRSPPPKSAVPPPAGPPWLSSFTAYHHSSNASSPPASSTALAKTHRVHSHTWCQGR